MATRTGGAGARFRELAKLPPRDQATRIVFDQVYSPSVPQVPKTVPDPPPASPPPTPPLTSPPTAPADSAPERSDVPSFDQVMDRLVRRFGWGGKRSARETLYRTLAKLVQLHGHPAMDAISEAAAQAASANRPDRYFCSAVTRKLAERGIRPGGARGEAAEDFFGRKGTV